MLRNFISSQQQRHNSKTTGLSQLAAVLRHIGVTNPTSEMVVRACKLKTDSMDFSIASHARELDKFNTTLYEHQPKHEACEAIADTIIENLKQKATICNDHHFIKCVNDILFRVYPTKLRCLQAFHVGVDSLQQKNTDFSNVLRIQCEEMLSTPAIQCCITFFNLGRGEMPIYIAGVLFL